MLNIGKIKLDLPFFQASLSGYSDRAMRQLAVKFGSPLVITGVILDKVALHKKAIKKPKFRPAENEHPVAAQILGTTPETMALSAKNFYSIGFDLIDLNFACPAPKVLKRARGGELLAYPSRILEIYRRVRDAVPCPVTAKLRTGLDNSTQSRENFWQIIESLAGENINALTIHGRTVKQKYTGSANWSLLQQVKNKFPGTTIIGSGDVNSPQDVWQKYNKYKLDGILIARAAIGNPWIFSQAAAIFKNQPMPPEPDLKQVGQTMIEQFEMILEDMPERKAVPYFRKFAAKYCKRHPSRKKAMLEILSAKSAEAVKTLIVGWFID
jgi:nifR3 family TIM-barrel protein